MANDLEMRRALKYNCVYKGPKWEAKVNAMSNQQVYQVYTKFKKEGKING